MAYIKLSPLLEKVRGRVGTLVFRRWGPRTVVQRPPRMTGLPASPAQRAQRDRFRRAIAYGRVVRADPARLAVYAERARARGTNTMALCVVDQLTAPTVEHVDLSAYTGRAGGTLSIAARDDFEVIGVEVVIRTAGGQVIERGPARRSPTTGYWTYATTAGAPVGDGLAIEVTAMDRPGNQATRVEWWGGGMACGSGQSPGTALAALASSWEARSGVVPPRRRATGFTRQPDLRQADSGVGSGPDYPAWKQDRFPLQNRILHPCPPDRTRPGTGSPGLRSGSDRETELFAAFVLSVLRPFRPRRTPAALLGLAALLACLAAFPAVAATYYWDNNGSTPGFGTAGGTWAATTAGNATQGWSTQAGGTVVPGSVTTTTADDLSFGTSSNGLAGGTLTVSGTVTNNTLTFGAGSGVITLSGGTLVLGGAGSGITVLNQNNTILSALLLRTNVTLRAPDFGTGSTVSTLTLGGALSGAGNVVFSSDSTVANNSQQTVLLNARSSYTGSTTLHPVGNGANLIVKLGVDDALPATTVLSLNGLAAGGSGRFARLEMNGRNQTLRGLQNTPATLRTQEIRNSSPTPSTLTISNSANHTFSGTLGENLALAKQGTGTLTLAGVNKYTNDTSITGGTLAMGGTARLGNGSYPGDLSIAGGSALLFNSSASTLLRGAVQGGGGLTNAGSGTVTLAGTNTLPVTTVTDGTLAVSASGRVTGTIVVQSGGELKLSGGGAVNQGTIQAGGQVSLAGAGVVTNLVFAGAGTLVFDVAAGGFLAVTATNGLVPNGPARSLTLDLTGAAPGNGTYTLIQYAGSLGGSGFAACQFGTGPAGRSYALVNAPGAVQLVVSPGVPTLRVETKADGTGVALPATTILAGQSLTNYAILRDGAGTFLTNTPAAWMLTNLTGAVSNRHLVAAADGRSAVFTPAGAGSARLLAATPGTNAVPSGPVTAIGLQQRPFIWVRESEKAAILDKIAANSWAATLFNGMAARVAAEVVSHQADRDAFLRGLPVNWSATLPTFNPGASSYDGGEGYFNTALDCAVLHYLTGDRNYARCAADILHNSVQAFQQLAPSTDAGNGGWLIPGDLLYEARQVGTQLPVVYDFLEAYLRTNQVYDVKAGGLTNFSFTNAQNVFRTYYQLVRDHGQKDSNWSALMSTCMLNNLLALDSASERAASLQVYLVTGSGRQASLADDYGNYHQPGDIWPESLQYAGAVGAIRTTHLVLLERYDPALNLLGVYSNLPASLPRISQLAYPNPALQVSFGDGFRAAGGQPFFRYELVYRHALDRGRTNLTTLFGSLLNGGVAAGSYRRSSLQDYSRLGQHDEPLQLLWQAASIPQPAAWPEPPRTDRLPFAGLALQRNPSPVDNETYGLMAFVGGAAHVHSHASGMSMELFGLGQVLGAKSGHDTYGSAIHENYYRLFAANNTVIVNGASQGSGGWDGLGINTVQVVAMEPQPFAAAVSSNVSFTCSSFADNMGSLAEATQQRTLALIRTSPTNGFYVDFFRSRSTVSNRVGTTLNGNVTNQFHDYLYHNIGSTNVSLSTNGGALPLVAQPARFQNDIGDAYGQPGWRYFTNTAVSHPHSQPTRARFTANPSGTTLHLDLLLPAIASREYARVAAPPIMDYDDTAPSPALVVRQFGEAWDRPFVAVYEPHFGATGGTVTGATPLWRSNTVVGLRIESIVAGSNRLHYVLSHPNPTESYSDPSIGLSFQGRFGVIADEGGGRVALYLGEGRSLSYRGHSMTTVSGANAQAEAQLAPGRAPLITANASVQVVTAAPPQFTGIRRQPDGVVVFSASGMAGVPYTLWGTTNPAAGSWAALGSGTVSNSPFLLPEAGATGGPARVFRFSLP